MGEEHYNKQFSNNNSNSRLKKQNSLPPIALHGKGPVVTNDDVFRANYGPAYNKSQQHKSKRGNRHSLQESERYIDSLVRHDRTKSDGFDTLVNSLVAKRENELREKKMKDEVLYRRRSVDSLSSDEGDFEQSLPKDNALTSRKKEINSSLIVNKRQKTPPKMSKRQKTPPIVRDISPPRSTVRPKSAKNGVRGASRPKTGYGVRTRAVPLT